MLNNIKSHNIISSIQKLVAIVKNTGHQINLQKLTLRGIFLKFLKCLKGSKCLNQPNKTSFYC